MSVDPTYPFARIEATWADRWQQAELFRARPDPTKPSFYVYEYPPYPNGKLHIGHVRN